MLAWHHRALLSYTTLPSLSPLRGSSMRLQSSRSYHTAARSRAWRVSRLTVALEAQVRHRQTRHSVSAHDASSRPPASQCSAPGKMSKFDTDNRHRPQAPLSPLISLGQSSTRDQSQQRSALESLRRPRRQCKRLIIVATCRLDLRTLLAGANFRLRLVGVFPPHPRSCRCLCCYCQQYYAWTRHLCSEDSSLCDWCNFPKKALLGVRIRGISRYPGPLEYILSE